MTLRPPTVDSAPEKTLDAARVSPVHGLIGLLVAAAAGKVVLPFLARGGFDAALDLAHRPLALMFTPAVAAVCAVGVLGLRRGYPALLLGILVHLLGLLTHAQLLGAVGAGLALGGLCLIAAVGSDWERLGVAAGFGLSLGLSALVFNARTDNVMSCGVVIVLAPIGTLLHRERVRADRVLPSALITAGSASLALAGLLLAAQVTSVIAALLAAALLIRHAGRIGEAGSDRPDLVRFALLGLAAAPMLPLGYYGFASTGSGLTASVACLAAAGSAGAYLALRHPALVSWEGLGLIVAALGLLTLGAVDTGLAGSNLPGLAVQCGLGFALSAGLLRVTGLPQGPLGAALGLATLLIAALALGPVTLDWLTGPAGIGMAAPGISLLAAVAVLAVRPGQDSAEAKGDNEK